MPSNSPTAPETSALADILAAWTLPDGPNLLDRVETMTRPALLAGYFGQSATRFVSGLQYHLGGAQDTRELAELAHLSAADRVLDACCFLGGPALQLAITLGCRVTGIDLNANAIAAAARIAQVAGLTEMLTYTPADAASLPFAGGAFTVVWNQCSFLGASMRWLEEFDRVLALGGRFAFTFEWVPDDDHSWTMDRMTSALESLGYHIDHADDITARDIEIGWKALDTKLSRNEAMFRDALGNEWVQNAHDEFRTEIANMSQGAYGNARIIGTKQDRPPAAR